MNYINGSVPIAVAAKVYGKDPNWIRAGLITGYLPIGKATRNGKEITDIAQQGHGGRINYYISPKLLYEATWYLWDGTRKIPSVLYEVILCINIKRFAYCVISKILKMK